ncbi:MAG: hypothetical protein C0614_08195, partial [Desulfuromonas sp.]
MTELRKSSNRSVSFFLTLGLSTLLILACGTPVLAKDTKVTPADTVITALEYSPRLQVLQHNQLAIGHERERAYGGYYPRVDLTVGYGTEAHSDRYTRYETDNPHDFYSRGEASLSLSQLIYYGKETSSKVGIEDA